MSKSKYYAVRKGRKMGVFQDWNICQNSISGYSGAEYKAFVKEEDAFAYIKNEDSTELNKQIAKEKNAVIAYVDGSYSDIITRYSYGCILILPSGEILRNSDSGNDPRALNVRNIAGELQGAMYAVRKAAELGYKLIIIRHDYIGISKWYTKEWKSKDDITKIYVDYLNKFEGKIKIVFEKVVAHSGDKYNDEADLLAKNELKKFYNKKIKENTVKEIDNKYTNLFMTIMEKKSKSKNQYSFKFKNMNITENKLKRFAKELWKLDNNQEDDISSIKLNFCVDTSIIKIEIINKKGNIKKYSVKI